MFRIKPVPCILGCSQIRCWGKCLFSIFITLQPLSKDCATVKLAGKSGCLNQNCQFNDNRYKWESFWHNAFIYTPLERIYCTAHPGFMYKTFLLDKIVVHFPIKILRHFIKSKGNKGSLILFSTKRYQPGALSRNTAWGKAEFQHEAEALPMAPTLFTQETCLHNAFGADLGADTIYQNHRRTLKNQDEMIQDRGLSLK